MRLFKRYTADTSPQLVSAVPISQDATAVSNIESSASERPEKKSKTTDNRLESTLPVKEVADVQKESMDSSVLIRKGRNIIKYGVYNKACIRACALLDMS